MPSSPLHRPATAALVVVLRLPAVHFCALRTATAQQSLCLAVEDENDCEALSSAACEHEAWQTVREGGCTLDDDVLCCVDDHGIGAGGVAALVAVVVVCVACSIHGIVQSSKGEAAAQHVGAGAGASRSAPGSSGVQVKVAPKNPKNGFAAVAAPVTASELACMPVAAAAIVTAQPVTAAQLSRMPVATATPTVNPPRAPTAS